MAADGPTMVDGLLFNTGTERIETPVPVVLEWAIGYLSFPQAEATDGYACQLNSECISSRRKSINYVIEVDATLGGYCVDVSFASLLRTDSKRKGLNFRTLIKQAGNGADVFVPQESICVISECSSTGLFFFQFSYVDGFDSMLENDVVNVSVWVKLHGVPFTKDGLSAIAINIGTHLRLDSYTSDMCIQSWGRSSYARVLIEIRADVEFKDTIVVAMPKLTRKGFYTCTFHVEYDIKKKGVETTKEISNSNPFDVLNAVVYDEELGTNGGGFKFGKKLEKLIIEGKVTLVDDDDGKPLKKVDYPRNHNSNVEVCLVDNDMACSMTTETVRFGTKNINECEDLRTYPCYGICNNTPEGYNCNCVQGAIGDGKVKNNCSCPKGSYGDPKIQNGCKAAKDSKSPSNVVIKSKSTMVMTMAQGTKKPRAGPASYLYVEWRCVVEKKINSHGYQDTMTLFSTIQFRKATNNYSQEQIVGRGGYGLVYKGVLSDKRVVAIKMSKIVDGSQAEEFHQRSLDTYASHPSKCGEAFGLLLGRRSPLKQNRLFKIVEPRLIREGTLDKLHTLADLVKRCLSLQSHDRPTMKEVTMELDGLRKLTTHPSLPQTSQQTRSLVLEIEQSDLYDARIVSYGPSESDSYLGSRDMEFEENELH
nr:wall-associated receptor kinase 2-like [Tanacetum cinerariifolium]